MVRKEKHVWWMLESEKFCVINKSVRISPKPLRDRGAQRVLSSWTTDSKASGRYMM